jgi:carbonic anhydrase
MHSEKEKIKKLSIVLMISFMLAWAGCGQKKGEPAAKEKKEANVVHWGYETDNGPGKWGALDPEWILCAEGLSQSPIDLAYTMEIQLPQTDIDLPSAQEVEMLNQKGVINRLDNGHTIQINAKTGETLTVGDKTYALVQFHFHAPSEHTVNGKHFQMEMHFVHQAEDGELAVVGVLIEEGAHNPGIAPLWEHLGHAPGTSMTVRIPAGFGDHIFSGDACGVYHYDGSLTTPPCSEGVMWYIRKTPSQLSKEQIAAFTAVYDHNNRPVQPLNDRELYLDKKPSLTVR